MPTNEQRRATAKRKLERQLERRAAQARRRRLFTIIGSVVAALVVVAAVVATVVFTNRDSDSKRRSGHQYRAEHVGARPAAPGTASCPRSPRPPISARTASTRLGRRPASPVKPPRTGKVPTEPAQVSASMETNQGNIGLMLDNGKSPCTVNSFASLANQGFFKDTKCHRLTTAEALSVLQCGDPTGDGKRRSGIRIRQRIPDQPVPARRPQADRTR